MAPRRGFELQFTALKSTLFRRFAASDRPLPIAKKELASCAEQSDCHDAGNIPAEELYDSFSYNRREQYQSPGFRQANGGEQWRNLQHSAGVGRTGEKLARVAADRDLEQPSRSAAGAAFHQPRGSHRQDLGRHSTPSN